MKENDALFVTSHAVAQFQKRIAALKDGAAQQMIRNGILRSRNVHVLPDGATVRVRTRRPFPFEFRVFCVYDARRHCSVATTIVRGDSNVTRKLKRRQRASTLGKKGKGFGGTTRFVGQPAAAGSAKLFRPVTGLE